jgi:UDP-N-acetylmuramyl pentapeptide phosphotransferase/UDP-N-acetylglucosamine-1-phosphate transferase
LSVLLVIRNPRVSTWFPLLLLAYPVFETLFSAYRRSLLRGHSAGHPDGLHLHTLLFRRVIGRGDNNSAESTVTQRNNRVAPQILCLTSVCVAPALVWWENTEWLIVWVIVFCFFYSWLYFRITRWKTPQWIKWF